MAKFHAGAIVKIADHKEYSANTQVKFMHGGKIHEGIILYRYQKETSSRYSAMFRILCSDGKERSTQIIAAKI